MAICILVLNTEENAYDFWESLKSEPLPIKKFQIIEPSEIDSQLPNESSSIRERPLPPKVKINDIPIFNPQLSRRERQKKMSLWLMPFGFLAGITFSGMTDLDTFAKLGLGNFGETILGGLLGMSSGFIGSLFAARSVDTNPDEIRGLLKYNKQGQWLILLETALETELPWKKIKEINPIEIANLNVI